jgi:hypothetical protein
MTRKFPDRGAKAKKRRAIEQGLGDKISGDL